MYILARFIIILTITCFSPAQQDTCLTTPCDCFEEIGDIEYQCPSHNSNKKVVIHSEGFKSLNIECHKMNSADDYLPNFTVSSRQITISECSLTESIERFFDRQQVNILYLENLKVPTSSSWYLNKTNNYPVLMKLSLKSVTFQDDIKFHAPKLNKLFLEDVNMKTASIFLQNHPQLSQLEINSNNIDKIEDYMFRNLSSLKILTLSNNNIRVIENGSFENLVDLDELQLDFNEIQFLNENTFKALRNLKALDLSRNNIGKINNKVFVNLKSLHNIYIDYNKNLELDEYLFANFSSLQSISLTSSNLKHVPDNSFSGSFNLTQIILANNLLTSISNKIFQNLNKLEILDLSNNKIGQLDSKTFSTLHKLQILDLHQNNLSVIDSKVLEGLENLKDIDLSNNKIMYLSNDSFRSNSQLEKINLSNNQITHEVQMGQYFTISPFSDCPNLLELDLSFNLIKDIPEDVFVLGNYLTRLNLEGNRIRYIELANLWKIASKGIIVNLENNNITRFSMHNFQFSKGNISKIELEYEEFEEGEDSLVLISHNPIQCDCYANTFLQLIQENSPTSGIMFDHDDLVCNGPSTLTGTNFAQVPPLKLTCPLTELSEIKKCTSSENCQCFWRPYDKTIIVDCIRKNLTEIPDIYLPSGLINYNQTEVHFEKNHLTKIAINKDSYGNVTKMYLNDNQINEIVWIPPNLEVLDLRKNKITNLSHDILDQLNRSSVKNISLGGNPWRCDCDIYNLTKFLRIHVKKVDVQNVRCNSSRIQLIDLNKSNICTNFIFFYLAFTIFFSMTLSTFAILIALYYKYKEEIKIWIYSKNLCIGFFEEEEMDSNKKFDIFISYSHKDEYFVLKELVNKLEQPPFSYKLCLHEREWIPGQLIAENVMYSVKYSKRTLVVLSKNFLNSVWGKMEFRIAHTEAMKEKRNRVILVLKEELDSELLDDELRSYIATNTYLKWDDKWFWQRLTYALPRSRIGHLDMV